MPPSTIKSVYPAFKDPKDGELYRTFEHAMNCIESDGADEIKILLIKKDG